MSDILRPVGFLFLFFCCDKLAGKGTGPSKMLPHKPRLLRAGLAQARSKGTESHQFCSEFGEKSTGNIRAAQERSLGSLTD